MKLAAKSAWSKGDIADFLEGSNIPIRIAVQDKDFPLICSVWFAYDATKEVIYCVSHESSYLVKLLKQAGRCAFEVAPNEPPYLGVRGKANVTVLQDDAGEVLHELINRYLGDTASPLAKWLLGRIDQELYPPDYCNKKLVYLDYLLLNFCCPNSRPSLMHRLASAVDGDSYRHVF